MDEGGRQQRPSQRQRCCEQWSVLHTIPPLVQHAHHHDLFPLLLCAGARRVLLWWCRHSLLVELRVLLVHGLLHLVGFDHEQGQQQLLDMAQQEASLLEQLGWEGSGLISLAAQEEPDVSTTAVVQPSSSMDSSGVDSSSSSNVSSTDSSSSDADGGDTGSVASVASGSSVGGSRWVQLR